MYMNCWKRVFGDEMKYADDNAMLKGFVNWSDSVTETVPADRLLVYDITQGWEPLCRFLGRPVPQDIDFPHVNEYRELRRYIRLERRCDMFLQYGLPAIAVFLIAVLLVKLFRMFVW